MTCLSLLSSSASFSIFIPIEAGALTSLVTILLFVGFFGIGGGSINNGKVGTKLGIVVILAFSKMRPVASWVIWAISALTISNIAIAVMRR